MWRTYGWLCYRAKAWRILAAPIRYHQPKLGTHEKRQPWIQTFQPASPCPGIHLNSRFTRSEHLNSVVDDTDLTIPPLPSTIELKQAAIHLIALMGNEHAPPWVPLRVGPYRTRSLKYVSTSCFLSIRLHNLLWRHRSATQWCQPGTNNYQSTHRAAWFLPCLIRSRHALPITRISILHVQGEEATTLR